MKGKIFNAQEMQAIIAGNKTMFREVIMPDLCPSYRVGQKIFCKESFAVSDNLLQDIKYLSDSQRKFGFIENDTADWKKRPAQHMKQEQSRLTLQIKSIKVERLRDISEEDARLEGFPVDHLGNYYEPSKLDPWQGYATASFLLSWNPTHKKPEEKFEANPWVFVYKFEVINFNK